MSSRFGSKTTRLHRTHLQLESLESRRLFSVNTRSAQLAAALSGASDSPQPAAPLAASSPLSASPAETKQTLSNIAISTTTGEKPQSKLWEHDGKWFSVLAEKTGTYVFRLDGATWTRQLKISSSTDAQADALAKGNVTHVLLYEGNDSHLASLEYQPATQTYTLWSQRPGLSAVTIADGSETATIDMDSTGRLWLVYGGDSEILARYSDGNYSSWSSEITIASGVKDDDIASIVAMPGNKIGVFWSNQSTKVFGFRMHQDGAAPDAWSADEKPGSSEGGALADDHINMNVTSDGTVYVAIKTSYDSSSKTLIGLFVRRPNGQWDRMYQVDTKGTRGTLVINEAANWLRVFYTTATGGGDIVYKESPLGTIKFGARQTLMTGSLNEATSTKQNVTDSMVIMASKGSSTAQSVLFSNLAPAGNRAPSVNAGSDATASLSSGVNLNGTVTDDGLPSPSSVTTTWSKFSGPGTVTFGNAAAIDTSANFSAAGTYVLQLSANDGALSSSDQVTVVVNDASTPPPPPSTNTLLTAKFQDGVWPTASYTGTRDTELNSDSKTKNQATAKTLGVDGSPDRSAMLKWDLSQIDSDSVVDSVSITLRVTDASKDGEFELYALSRNWVDTDVNWTRFSKSGGNWGTAGASGSGDHASAVLGTLTGKSKGLVTINLNAAGVAVVQSWIDNPASNHGFIIQDYAGSSDKLEFSSREASTKTDRPLLSISYRESTPVAAAAMAGFAAPTSSSVPSSAALPQQTTSNSAPVVNSSASDSSNSTFVAAASNNAVSKDTKPSSSVPVSVYDELYGELGA